MFFCIFLGKGTTSMVFDLIYFFGVGFCFITAFMLLFKENPNRLFPIYLLGFYFFFNGIAMLFYLLVQYEILLAVPYLYKIPAPFTFLIAPLAYLYLRSMVYNEKKFKSTDWIHAVPFVVFFINYLPFYLMPLEEKEELVKLVLTDFSLTYTHADGLLPEWTNVTFRTILSLVYLSLMGRLLYISFRKNLLQNSSHLKKIKRWMNFFYFSLSGYTLSLLIFYILVGFFFNGLEESFIRTITNMTIAAFFLILSAYLIAHPQILLGLNDLLTQTNQQKETTYKSIILRFKEYMEDQMAYLDSSANAAAAADHLKISQRSLSIAISELNYKNFNDYINTLRLNHFLSLIKKEEANKYDIIGLAIMSGFSSKTTFYRVFNERMKMTPNEYLNSLE